MNGEDIKALRIRLGLSQKAFATAIGTTKARVSDWERGKHKATLPFRMLIEQLKQKSNDK